jgi:hypothetical protein
MRERSGWRDQLYSRWHRPEQIARFVGIDVADSLGLIDGDWIEYCRTCSQPLALFELTCDWSKRKAGTVTKRLAEMAQIPAYVVYYKPNEDSTDILHFAVDDRDKLYTPAQYAAGLVKLRSRHECDPWRIPW